jgi:hypothetical protein
MTYRTPRCIATPDGKRCPRLAGKRSGDLFVCPWHARLITMALIDDMLAPSTRWMLAFTRWETPREGQRLIDRLHRREAA